MVLQSQVPTDAYNLGIQAPLITTAVLKRFQDCNFYGTDPFDVADGILPLAFTPPGGSAATLKREHEAAANVAAYDTMISTHGNSLSLKDSLDLQKTKAYIPLDWTEATTQLKSYLAVLATILGATHNVVKAYQRSLSRLEWQQMPLRRAIADELGDRITPAIVVYYFQVRIRGWLEEQWEADTTLPSPDFGEDIHRFRMTQNLNWLPNVSNVDALRALQQPSTPIAPPSAPPAQSGGALPSRGNNPRQDQLHNPTRDSRFSDPSDPISARITKNTMRSVIAAMKTKGKTPVKRPDEM
eukprot:jgi/Psemu1/54452/gm1.54452_g